MWFQVWGPEDLEDEGIGSREDWVLRADDRVARLRRPGFRGSTCSDPIKATVITPGLTVDGTFQSWGVPALILTKYLTEHGIVVEKTGLYSFFIMFTIGITKGRWNTMVTELQQFKDDYDNNQPLWRVMPEFVAAHPQVRPHRAQGSVSADARGINRANDVAHLTTQMYTYRTWNPVLRPAEAYAKMAHREIDRVPIDLLEGRVTSRCC